MSADPSNAEIYLACAELLVEAYATENYVSRELVDRLKAQMREESIETRFPLDAVAVIRISENFDNFCLRLATRVNAQ